ncbi:aminotransferase class III-fold pyridoxal phosphate-dependent enzyme [Synergistaceae bacterium OttesenSCG-928-D05]|nr:aminotransferase class III-fold pyridoxal phosphate-dependent enzyme [Synergistaceae bacterium OttesenSCG-928-D05]
MVQHAFPRSFKTSYLNAVRGEGIYIYDADGKAYIDGCCGALVSNLGHAVPEIADAISKQCHTLEFAHPSRWSVSVAEEAAAAVADFAPADLNSVWFVSGGSEAIESAVKLARQYYVERDGADTSKHLTIGRWNSYHGSTLGTMAIAGSMPRRRLFAPLYRESPKVAAHYCYRCPFEQTYPSCKLLCARQLESEIRRIGPQYITSFIAEPVGGSTVAALMPPKEYLPMVREICDKYDIMLIADEVMSGCGRTGRNFAVDHWGVVPDIIATAKGLAAGFVPTGGIIARDYIVDAIKNGSGAFGHGHTYNGNPVSAAAVVAVMKYMKEHDVVNNAAKVGKLFGEGLQKIAEANPMVGEVRGIGLMWGFELVKDKASKAPFEKSANAAAVATKACIDELLIIYPGGGMIDGIEGDNFMIAPPLVTTEEQAKEILRRLEAGLASAAKKLL